MQILVDVNAKVKKLVREWCLSHFIERPRDTKEENRKKGVIAFFILSKRKTASKRKGGRL